MSQPNIISPTSLNDPETDSGKCEKEYDLAAAGYDDILLKYRCTAPAEGVAILEKYVSKDAMILDVGCGTGVVGEELQKIKYSNIEGIDISKKMLSSAKEKEIYNRLHCGDLQQSLRFASNYFDACILIGVFTHIEKASFLMRELIRIIKSGGYIVFSQRDDLFERFNYKEKIDAITSESLWKQVYVSDSVPYIPGLPEFASNNVTVKYYVFQVESTG